MFRRKNALPGYLHFLSLAAAASILTALPVAASSAGTFLEPPEVVRMAAASGQGQPVWISAHPGTSEDGNRLDLSLLTKQEATVVEMQLRASRQNRSRFPSAVLEEDPCAGTPASQADYYVAEPSIEDLAVHSAAVFGGTIVWAREGLHRGWASTLYGLSVDKIWKYDERVTIGDIVLVSFPKAQIKVDDGWLCSRSLRYPTAPTVGSRALVFSSEQPGQLDPIYDPIDQEIFFEAEGELSVPRHLRREQELSSMLVIEQLVADILGDPERAK